jgi:hypothetical protein
MNTFYKFQVGSKNDIMMIVRKGILNLTGKTLKVALNYAAAGVTCSRQGAQSPCKFELKGL